MSLIKGIKVGSTDITGTYVADDIFSDTEGISVTAVNLGQVGEISPINDMMYSGIPQEPLPTVTAVIGGETVVLVKDTDYTISYSDNINVGTATVTATGINNYTGSVSTTWNIISNEIVVEASDQNYVYDGTAKGQGVSVTTTDGTATVMYGWSQGDYTLSDAPRITDVSQSGTVYYQVTAPNHNSYTGSYQLVIRPLTAILTWGDLIWLYDGEEHHTTCTVSNLVSGDVCTVTLNGNTITNIGNTTVTATGLSNPNYALGNSNLSRTLTVSPGLYINMSGSWIPVKKVFRMVSGTWVQQAVGSSFSTEEKYVNKN